jgi:di/tricarboxylate transporter
LGFFSFTPFGIAILALAMVYMLFVGRRMLSREARAEGGPRGTTMADLIKSYGLLHRVHRLLVPSDSPLIDRAVARMKLRVDYGINLIGFEKHHFRRRILTPPAPDTMFEAGDQIFVVADEEELAHFTEAQGLIPLALTGELGPREAAEEIGLAEVMLTPESKLIGQTLEEMQFHAHYNLTVLALRRRGKPVSADLAHLRLDFGDALLVSGSWLDILRLRKEHENIVVLTLPEEFHSMAPARHRAPWALVILAAMVGAMAFRLLPNVAAALLAAVALVATRCVKLDAVYRVIGWQTVVLIAAILPLATAFKKTGATRYISTGLVDSLGSLGPLGMLAVVFLITSAIGLFISNSATAVLVAPIAIEAALTIGVSPHAFAMTVAIACSAAYATPVSSPVNTLVLDPGGYSFMDFVKVGLPLQLLTLGVTVALARVLFPF